MMTSKRVTFKNSPSKVKDLNDKAKLAINNDVNKANPKMIGNEKKYFQSILAKMKKKRKTLKEPKQVRY